MNIWIRLIDASIPFLGGIITLLICLKIIPFKKGQNGNKIFYEKHSKLMISLAIILLFFSFMRVLGL